MAKRLLSCLLVICLLLTSGIVYAAPSDGSPSKEEKEDMLTFTVDGAIMKVEVCAANTIHVRWAPGDQLPDKGEKTYTVDYDKSFNDFTVAEANNVLTVKTTQLTVTVDKATGKITYRDAAGNLLLVEPHVPGTERDVLPDRLLKQLILRVLEHQTDTECEGTHLLRIRPYLVPADKNLAGGRLIEPVQQLDKRGFSGAGMPHQPGYHPAVYRQ